VLAERSLPVRAAELTLALPQRLITLYTEYADSVIIAIARRLGKLDFASSTAAWQMQRLSESGKLYENILSELTILTGKTSGELQAMFEKAGVKAMTFDDGIYKAAGLQPIPLNLSPAMKQVLAAGLNKTQGIMKNLTMTTAISGQNAFIDAADLAYMQITSGAFDYNTAIRQAVKDVADKGLPVIHFSGRQDHLDVAMRRYVLTGVNQTVGKLQEARADEMGVDLVAVSAHIGARNTGTGPANHEGWQGKVYSRSGTHAEYPSFIEKTGYGSGEGLMGWNCVVGETVVSGPAICAGYRREYSGEIIILHTAGGKELSCTPNHPILTNKGWIAAGLLTKGDNVISRIPQDRINGGSPNIDQGETRIQDIFDSLSVNGDIVRFPSSAGYFHGDVSNGEVDVIFPDGFLRGCFNSRFQGTPVFLLDSCSGYPGIVELDNIIFIERKSTQGSFVHVYNLETEGGWYFANDIVIHNCRHSFYPFFEGISENAYSNAELESYVNKTVTYNGQEISVYEATQQQREIERKIRYWKRQEGALKAAHLDTEYETGKVREWQARMRDFTKQTRLGRQYEREQIFTISTGRKTKIDFSLAISEVIGKTADLKNYFPKNTPGKEYIVSNDVVLTPAKKKHIWSNHQEQINWLESHPQAIQNVLLSPRYIDAVPTKKEGRWAITHIAEVDHDLYDLLVIGVRYGKTEKEKHRIITIFLADKRFVFDENGIKSRWLQIK
jgi:hypothetical protein